jgi:MFS family permease
MSKRATTTWTFVVVSVAVFMASLDNLIVTTALPVIKAELGATLQGLQWTVNAYTLTFAVLLLSGAALGDRFGRKRMFIVGISIFMASMAVYARNRTRDLLTLSALWSRDAEYVACRDQPRRMRRRGRREERHAPSAGSAWCGAQAARAAAEALLRQA